MERTVASLVEQPKPDEQYQPGVCGSCYWRRSRRQLGRVVEICSCMPKQVTAVARGEGAQIICMNPVIENLAEELCAMWKPMPGDTQ